LIVILRQQAHGIRIETILAGRRVRLKAREQIRAPLVEPIAPDLNPQRCVSPDECVAGPASHAGLTDTWEPWWRVQGAGTQGTVAALQLI
jgi:hypothetical protein